VSRAEIPTHPLLAFCRGQLKGVAGHRGLQMLELLSENWFCARSL
jgi:hypothetical protein